MQPKHMKVVAIHIKITFHFLKFFISEPDIYFKYELLESRKKT